MEHIFIPSKKRSTNSPFIGMCNSVQCLEFSVVVEQEDLEDYKAVYPMVHYIVLPLSNQGITYVRNFIKQYASNNGLKKYWMIDDDINGLYRREGQKMIKDGIDILRQAEVQFSSLQNAGMCGLEYQQLAWSATKDQVKNSFCDCVVLIDVEKTNNITYRPHVEGKEDRDFAMRVIEKGFDTYRSTLYAFSAPANGSNKGGLKESFYDLGKEALCAERMVELWGAEVCQQITKPNGRKDVKIHWDRIRNKKFSIF